MILLAYLYVHYVICLPIVMNMHMKLMSPLKNWLNWWRFSNFLPAPALEGPLCRRQRDRTFILKPSSARSSKWITKGDRSASTSDDDEADETADDEMPEHPLSSLREKHTCMTWRGRICPRT